MQIRIQYLYLIIAVILSSCYEKKEGCLDIYATNFTPEADINCCCDYPRLQLSFSHLSGGVPFKDTALIDAGGHEFKILNFTYYLSSFGLKDANGNAYSTNDTFHLPTSGNYIILKDDIALIRPSTSLITLGSFKQLDPLKLLSFQFGPPAEADQAKITSIPDERSLSQQAEMLFTEGIGYASIKLNYSVGTDTTSLYIYDKIPMSLPVDIPNKIGSNTCLSFTIDYNLWFKNVDLLIDDQASIRSKIINNIPGSMLIKSCD